jgi:hypothetical protein
VAAAAAAARAAKEAELEAKRAKEAVPTTGVAAAASEPGSAPAAGKTPRRHRARAATKTAKLDTKAGGAKSEAKKNDAIDELLKKMGK